MLVLPLINFAVPWYSHFRLGATKEQLVENELNFFFIIRNSRDSLFDGKLIYVDTHVDTLKRNVFICSIIIYWTTNTSN